ncbi:HlyD family secretion protein [Paludibacterium paludis]|nr:efflux RND transporter periplasmic adaptor subunit [Paludibacterium paludis]
MKWTKLLIVAAVLVAAGTAFKIWQARQHVLPDGLIQTNGRLEGDQTLVSSKYPGRLASVKVGEGDMVAAGQVVATLDAAELQARRDAAKAALASAGAQKIRAAAQLAQARRDAARFADLLTRGSVDRVRAEQMQLAAVAAGTVLAQSQEQERQAAATVREVDAMLAEQALKAPVSGVVTSRLRLPGEVVGAGGSILDIVNLDTLYLKVYVPENQIGRVRLGLPARIYTDAFPGTAFEARVSYIASRAEFTPKEVQTPDERVKLVYAVKLNLVANPQHRLTPGLPADAVIRWKDGVQWQKPHW